MNKIKSLEELKKIRDAKSTATQLRTTGENPDRTVITVGMATCGIAAGARKIMSTLVEQAAQKNLDNVSIIATGCLGFCYAEPLVEVREPGRDSIRYGNVDEARAIEIIDKHIIAGELIDNAILGREV